MGPILVGIASAASALRLVRAAAGLAAPLGMPWQAVHIRLPKAASADDEFAAEHLDRAFALAERLGGRTAIVNDTDVAQGLLRAARDLAAGSILIGQSRPGRGWRGLGNSISRRLRRSGAGLQIRVLPQSPLDRRKLPALVAGRLAAGAGAYAYALATLAVVFATGLALAIRHAVPAFDGTDVAILAAIVFSAVRFGVAPGLYAAVLGAGLYAALLSPAGIRLGTGPSLISLAIFVSVGLLASHLAGRMRERVTAGLRREVRLRALFRLSRDIAGAAGSQDVLRAIVHQIDEILGARSVLLLPTGPHGLLQIAYPPGAELSVADAEAAEWAFHFEDVAGRGTHTVEEAMRLYQPMRVQDRAVGVLGMGDTDEAHFRDPEYRWLLDALALLAASAIERMNLAQELTDARVVAETDSLRAALLSSISHDLRTPLSTIIGSASTLQRYGHNLDEPTRLDLLAAIREEAERLNRFIRNLLDMTRIEAGAIVPKRQSVALGDIVGSALERLEDSLSGVEVRTEIEPDLPLAHVDFVLMEQVLVNLIENAAKFSPERGEVKVLVGADRERGRFRIDVCDRGIGISEDDLPHIFDKFYRARSGDRRIAGTGLGLSICKGLVAAHGGTIYAESAGPGQGSRFRVELPMDVRDGGDQTGIRNAESREDPRR